jgi:hypothetical protein
MLPPRSWCLAAPVLALLLAAGVAAAAPVPADTTAVPGGSGSGGDPWLIDPDEALKEGYGIFLAEEDTFAFAAGTLDTVLVDAPRIGVAEVVRRIGERMAADEARMGDHAWTQVTRVVAREHAGRDDDRTEYEQVERLAVRRDGAFQRVRVRQVERKYRGDRLEKEKTDDDVESDWEQISDATSAIPFTLEGADQYNYTVLARDLFGSHLVYTLRFTPKSRFRGLPSGTVWIDCSDFVIRRIEAGMTEGAPLPLVVKAIPWFKIRRVERGDFWVVADVMAKIELRGGWPGLPDEVELFVRTRDHVIGGVAYGDDAPADGGGAR